jgi:hypothetical protein
LCPESGVFVEDEHEHEHEHEDEDEDEDECEDEDEHKDEKITDYDHRLSDQKGR